MPIFDYACTKCQRSVEQLVKSSEQLVTCELCGKPMTRQLSAPNGFILKGAGFYQNDRGRVPKSAEERKQMSWTRGSDKFGDV